MKREEVIDLVISAIADNDKLTSVVDKLYTATLKNRITDEPLTEQLIKDLGFEKIDPSIGHQYHKLEDNINHVVDCDFDDYDFVYIDNQKPLEYTVLSSIEVLLNKL